MRLMLTASMIALMAGATAAGAANMNVTQKEQAMLDKMSPELRQEVQSRLTDDRRVGAILETMYLNELRSNHSVVRGFDMQPDGYYYALVRERPDTPWQSVRIDPRTSEFNKRAVSDADAELIDSSNETIKEQTVGVEDTKAALPQNTTGMDEAGGEQTSHTAKGVWERSDRPGEITQGTPSSAPAAQDRTAGSGTGSMQKSIEEQTERPGETGS